MAWGLLYRGRLRACRLWLGNFYASPAPAMRLTRHPLLASEGPLRKTLALGVVLTFG
jgi:hypothetical protein